jgi:hypothetical protein
VSASGCFHAARTAFRECRDACDEGKPGKECRITCRSLQVTDDADCSITFAACLGACAPVVTTTLTEPTTTTVPTTTLPEPTTTLAAPTTTIP